MLLNISIYRRFWSRAILTATPTAQKHFIEAFDDYLDSVVTKAEERDKNVVLDIERYLQIRRQNIGARPSYVPAELGLDIPDKAFYHPVMIELTYYSADLIILDNVSLF